MPDATRQRLLRIGVARLGLKELAARLKVRPGLLAEWVDGESPMPDRKFIGLVSLLDELGALGDEI